MSDTTPLTRGEFRKAFEAMRDYPTFCTPEDVYDAALATLDEPTQCARYLCSQGQSEGLDVCSTAIMGTHLPSEPCVRCARPLSAHQPAVPCVQSAFGGVTERPQPAPPCSEPDAKPAASAALPEIKAVGWYHPNPHGKDITRPAYGQSFSYGEEHPPNAQYEPLVPLATARAYADALTEAQRECERLTTCVKQAEYGEQDMENSRDMAIARAEQAERERDEARQGWRKAIEEAGVELAKARAAAFAECEALK